MLLPNRQNDQIATIDIRKHSLYCDGSGYRSYCLDRRRYRSTQTRYVAGPKEDGPCVGGCEGLAKKPNEAIEQTKLFFEISCTIAAVILVINFFLWLK